MTGLPFDFDWKNPDYSSVFNHRLAMLERMRSTPGATARMRAYYRQGDNLADFINDWGVTYDPRNPEIGLPPLMPFVLFPKQREAVEFILRKWRGRSSGLIEKSRDVGVSWLAVAVGVGLCVLHDGVSIGYGSRKSEYVDKLLEMKALLPKARMFAAHLPEEFRAGFVEWRDAPLMRLMFPETGSSIGGEGGDDVGRGDRRSIYFVDEFAHFERPDLVDRALSQTTNCRIDMSSVNGMNNAFARRRWGGRVEVFIFDWRDDPRKDDEWYALLSAPEADGGKGLDDVTIAQEVDRDYGASVSGIVIPAAWVRSAIDAREKLGFAPAGVRGLSLDVADEGLDKNAIAVSCGIEIETTKAWSGKGADIYATTERAFEFCDEFDIREMDYDEDGLGAGVRGDARVINEKRKRAGAPQIAAHGWRGSNAVVDPDAMVEGTLGRDGEKGRTNKDYFANRKAQGWWALRRRFQKTYNWIVHDRPCNPDEIISISSKCPDHLHLVAELSQATFKTNEVGKILIQKRAEKNKMPSPNRADAVVIRFAPKDPLPFVVTQDVMRAVQAMPPRRRRY